MDLKHIIPQQRRRVYGPSLDIQYSVDKTNVPRVGPTPTFTRASSGTFVNENRRIVGKTTSTTSLNPASVAVGGVAVFTVPSGSVVGWLNDSVVSVMVDSDGNDQIGSEAHITGTLIHKSDTTITLLVTSKVGTTTLSSWFVSYRGQRIDHDPTTGRCLGSLVEEARTNLFPQSEGFNVNTVWTIARLVSQPVANTEISPDNTQSAEKLIPTTENNDHRIDKPTTSTVVSGTVYSHSVFAKASGYTGFGFGFGSSPVVLARFSLVGSGSVTFQASGSTATITSYPNGWYRCTMSIVASVSGARSYLFVGKDGNTFTYAGDGTSGIILWGAQLEAGSIATSYIPTTVISAARSADVPTISGNSFSNFYNQNQGSFIANYDRSTSSGGGTKFNWMLLAAYNPLSSTTYNIINATPTSDARTIYRHSGTDVYGPVPSLSANGTLVKIGYGYQSSNFATTKNGSLVATGTQEIPVPSTFDRVDFGFSNNGNFGAASTQYLNGHINSIRYYRNRLTNTQLQTETAIVSDTIVYNGMPIWYNGGEIIETT